MRPGICLCLSNTYNKLQNLTWDNNKIYLKTNLGSRKKNGLSQTNEFRVPIISVIFREKIGIY